MLVSALTVATIVAGVLVVGSSTFDRLMLEHGGTAAVSQAMFNESITRVVLAASLLAVVGSLILAIVLGRMIERPLDELASAARRVAEGGYDARVQRPRAPELASVADSFNQMAASLEDQERQRRELILNFAHELRTPLTNLHGYMEGLREGVVEPGPEIFAALQGEVARLNRLSNSLEALAEGVDPERRPEELDLVALIKALLELNRPRFEGASIKVNVDMPARLPARAEPDSLSQVIAHLLQNAARYTPASGTVWVRAEQQRDSVLLSVANTGPGIPARDLGHVFERFYRVEKPRDSARGGGGLPPPILNTLGAAGGCHGCAQARGRTTTLWVRLPASRWSRALA